MSQPILSRTVSGSEPRAPAAEASHAEEDAPTVFLSYSRRDMAFVDRLDAALQERGVETLVDRAAIEAGENWLDRLKDLIGRAETIVFVLSPDSVRSTVCAAEVEHGRRLGKRFIPVVARRIDDPNVPQALAELNYVFLDDEAAWPANVERLVTAIRTDLAWMRLHADLGRSAEEWSRAGRPRGLLLGPTRLSAAEQWIAQRPSNAPLPTEDTRALIAASRRAARQWRNGLIGALAFGLALALGLAALAYSQRQEAVAQRDAAERAGREATEQRDTARRALADAKGAADVLIFDIAQGLRGRGLPIQTVRDVLGRAETLMTRLVASAPRDPGLLRSQAAAFAEFADTYAAAGDTEKRRDMAERALAIFRHLADLAPTDAAARRDLTVSLVQVGDARLARGDLPGGLESYRKVLAIRRPLAASGPAAARDLALVVERIGDVQMAQGDLAAALASHEEALAIRRGVAVAQPAKDGSADANNVALSLVKVGDVRVAQGDAAGALASYRESLALRRRLAAEAPTDDIVARDLSVSLERVADVHAAQGDLAGAMAHYDEALGIRRRLFELDPLNARGARDLFVGLLKTGDVRNARADATGALANYEESLAIGRRLADQNPSDTGVARDLLAGVERVGDALEKKGDLEGAFARYVEFLGIARRLARRDPSNAQWRADLVRAARRLGALAFPLLAKAPAQALRSSDLALEAAPELISPRINRAHALMLLGRLDEARALYLAYRGRMDEDGTLWEEVVRGDFGLMRKARIAHPMMDEIEATFAKP